MLQGTLTYVDETHGTVMYSVYARDTFNDLKMYLENVYQDYTSYTAAQTILDMSVEDGVVTYPYAEVNTSEKRRLDIRKVNKFKTNIVNRQFCARVGAFVRYVDIMGKKNYNKQDLDFEFDDTRVVEIENFGVIHYKMGLATEMHIKNQYVSLDLVTVPDDRLETGAIFKELKEKDKYGHVLSATPIVHVGFKLDKEFLGFDYVPAITTEYASTLGMYETIEDVIANHPDKNTDWILERDYRIVSDENLEEVIKMFNEHDGFVAFDTETSGLRINFKSRTNEADQLVGVVLSIKKGSGYYFPLQHKLFPNLCGGDHHYFMDKYMRPILEKKPIVAHNILFDWKVAYIYDINVNCVYDTMIAFGVTKRYEEESFEYGLKALAKNILGLDMFDLDDFVTGSSFSDSNIAFWDLPYEIVRRYAPVDADMTLSLYEYLEHHNILNKYEARRIFDLEIDFAKCVAYSEFFGYHIDTASIPDLEKQILGNMDECQKIMFEIAGKEFNPKSSQQLAEIIYDELKIPPVEGKRSTSKDLLAVMARETNIDGSPKYPFIVALKKFRDNEGIYKNFLKKLHEFSTPDGFIFPGVLPLGTNTGRCSVKNPNYQSYNDAVKQKVTPREGYVHIDSDFAQIEQRVLVSMADSMFPEGEPLALMKDFDDPDMDYHQYQAARMFNVPYASVTKSMRQQSKGINFGLPYGMGDQSLGARIFGERTEANTAKAVALREKFFMGQEKIGQFFEVVRDGGVKNGYTSTKFGRRRYYHKGKFTTAQIRRQAGNHVIQGCLSGKTRIQTKEYGIVKIKEVVGEHLHVWDGYKWTPADITYSGLKQKCKVYFKGGLKMVCSPIHKFLVKGEDGQETFIECKDLASREVSDKPHRVKVNEKGRTSCFDYSSAAAYEYAPKGSLLLEDSNDDFGIGFALGYLVLKGDYHKTSVTYHLGAEDTKELQYLKKVFSKLTPLSVKTKGNKVQLTFGSKYLVHEIDSLDVKKGIDATMFMSTEMVRGFLQGLFHGGVSEDSNCLCVTVQEEKLSKDVQKALLFNGIRSTIKHTKKGFKVEVLEEDIITFNEGIGFLEDTKGFNELSNNSTPYPLLEVERVEITSHYIPMYDVCNTQDGYYVADGVITHNTAADIYKLAVVSLFRRVCKEGWLGLVLFNAFVHDEVLLEVHKSINLYYFMTVWREEFEVKIDGFCRLFAGVGVGSCWYKAKKQDLPPQYTDILISEYHEGMAWDEDLQGFIDHTNKGLEQYFIDRVKDYILDPTVQGQVIKPAIFNILGGVVGDIVKEIKADPQLVEDYNAYIGKEVLSSKGLSSKDLQDQLKVYCKYYGIDYSKVNIVSLDEVGSVAQESQPTTTFQVPDFEYDDVDPLTLIFETVKFKGYYTDFSNRILYIGLFEIGEYKTLNALQKIISLEGLYRIVIFTDTEDSSVTFPTKYFVSSDDLKTIGMIYKTVIAQGGTMVNVR